VSDPHLAPAAADARTAPVEAHHGYDFMAVLMHHLRPSPAIEYVHHNPVLILDLAGYAGKNLAHLKSTPAFDAADGAAYAAWAESAATTYGTDSATLAKAMTVASQDSLLGTLPKPLSFLNQQTFFGTFALIGAALLMLVFGRRRPDQLKPANRLQHTIEAMVLFIRDDVVRPNIQHHADAWVPHFTALFIAILAINLVGLSPVFSAASGNPGVTTAFALMTLLGMLFYGIKEQGPVAFWINLVPIRWSWKPFDMFMWFLLLPIELLGLFVRPVALSIRLFANMFAGHAMLLAFSCLGYIILNANPDSHGLSLGMGAFGMTLAISLYFLELLVCFLQAYVFTVLSAVFIGAAMHPEH
jgi:F-type H+-transporting ATPase subunit a